MSNNERLVNAIRQMIAAMIEVEDTVAACQLQLALNMLNEDMKERLEDNWEQIQGENIYEGQEILKCVYLP